MESQSIPGPNEFILFRAKGGCYKFVRVAKEWSKMADGCSIMLLHDRARNLHRIVCLQDDGSVVLESALFAGLESELKKNFLQWRDGQRIFGVKFADDTLGSRFSQRLTSVVNGIGKEDPTASLRGSERKTIGRVAGGSMTASKESVVLLTPRQQTSRELFQRVESMAMPESYSCCVCGVVRNDLLLKSVVGNDGSCMVDGVVLKLKIAGQSRKLCTGCWIKNLTMK